MEIELDTYAKLKYYSEELGLDLISIEDLIDSHRHLRNMQIVIKENVRRVVEIYRSRGYEDGYVNAINREFIPIDKLKQMSIIEFVNLISNR
jgi:hypothetical protein